MSAQTGEGLATLVTALAECVGKVRVERRLRLPPTAGRLRSRLFALGAVVSESVYADGCTVLDVLIPPADLERLSRHDGLDPDMIEPLLRATGT